MRCSKHAYIEARRAPIFSTDMRCAVLAAMIERVSTLCINSVGRMAWIASFVTPLVSLSVAMYWRAGCVSCGVNCATRSFLCGCKEEDAVTNIGIISIDDPVIASPGSMAISGIPGVS